MAEILARVSDPTERYRRTAPPTIRIDGRPASQWGTFDDAELIAQTVDHYALWLGRDGPKWTGEHYLPSAVEMRQIATEELERARNEVLGR